MGMSSGGSKGVKSDINVTPLVDVVLVLLIIFMVVTPELQRGKEVKLPIASQAAQRKDGGDPLIVSFKSDKTTFIEQEEVPMDKIAQSIKDSMVLIPNRSVLIKGDAGLTYGDVKKLIAEIRASGVQSVSLAASTPEGK